MFTAQTISEKSSSRNQKSSAVQPKLKVNKADDSFEKEADAVAERVINTPSNSLTDTPNSENNSIQTKGIQRQLFPEKENHEEQEIEPQSDGIKEKGISSFADPLPISRLPKNTSFQQSLQRSTEEDFGGQFTDSMSFGNMGVQMRGNEGGFETTSSFDSDLQQAKGGGTPLPEDSKASLEPELGADLSGVRVHSNPKAESLNENIGSRAFTVGSDIFFNRNEYNPGTTEGDKLIAHETTHTVQQGATAQRKPKVISKTRAPRVQGLLGIIRSGLARFARYIPGYTLMTVIVGFNPLSGESVAKTPENLLGGILGLIPVFGTLLYDKLVELGIISSAMTWVRGQLQELDLSVNRIERTLDEAWDRVSIIRGWDYNVNVLDQTFGQLFRDIRTFAGRVGDKILDLIKEALMTALKALAESFPGYPLLTKIIGKDPLTGEIVDATTADIIEEFLILIGKEQELEKMKEEGSIQRTADWIDEQLALLNLNFEEIKGMFETAWDAFSMDDVRDPIGAFTRTINIFRPFTSRLFTFAVNVAVKVLKFIKDVLLRQLADYARTVRGYHLVTVILGRDPFTNDVVERNVENIIRGFMSLMDGGEEKFQEMKQTGAIQRASDQIQAAVDELGFNLAYIVGLFIGLWKSFSIEDIFHPLDAFMRIIDTLGQPIGRLIIFLVRIIKIVVVVILEVMNFPFELIGQIIANTQSAFNDIKRDPIQFFLNLLGAVKKGFEQFFDNFLTHLMNGVRDWLFGQLGDAGITPPSDLSLQSILGLVLEILGISADRIWEKLEQRIGAERVAQIRGMIDRLTGIWAFVKDVTERGPVAIWEYVQEKISDLWNVVIDGIRNWIMTRIVEQVTVKLLSMLDPTGIMAVVNSFIAFYKAVQSFIEQLRAMLEIVNSFVAGIASIARGSIAQAANFLENALAQGIPVAIGFLANQVGLGGLGRRVGEMIERVREKVDLALDWLIDKAVTTGSRILNALTGGGANEEENQNMEQQYGPEKGAQIAAGLQDIDREEQQYLSNEKITEEEAHNVAITVKSRHPVFSSIEIVDAGPRWDYRFTASPANTKQGQPKDIPDPPNPDKPGFTNGRQASSFDVKYLRTGKLDGGSPASANNGRTLPGWAEIQRRGLSTNAAWVKMHLLTEILGGPALDTNLTPARGPDTNLRFRDSVEHPAKAGVDAGNVIWYDVTLRHHSSPDENFPSYLKMEWGPHVYENDAWVEKPSGFNVNGTSIGGSDDQSLALPPTGSGTTEVLNINTAGRVRIEVLDPVINRRFAEIITEEVQTASGFSNLSGLIAALQVRQSRSSTITTPRIQALRNAEINGMITFN